MYLTNRIVKIMPLPWLNGRQTEIHEKTNALRIGGPTFGELSKQYKEELRFYINESFVISH